MAANDIARDLCNELEYIGDKFIERAECEDNAFTILLDDGVQYFITVEEV